MTRIAKTPINIPVPNSDDQRQVRAYDAALWEALDDARKPTEPPSAHYQAGLDFEVLFYRFRGRHPSDPGMLAYNLSTNTMPVLQDACETLAVIDPKMVPRCQRVAIAVMQRCAYILGYRWNRGLLCITRDSLSSEELAKFTHERRNFRVKFLRQADEVFHCTDGAQAIPMAIAALRLCLDEMMSLSTWLARCGYGAEAGQIFRAVSDCYTIFD